ncbi:MAG: hypothetical protein WCV88_01805 [Patescibacteria group bacterium]
MNSRSEQFNLWLQRYYSYVALVFIIIIVGGLGYGLLWPQYQRMQTAGSVTYSNIIDIISQHQLYVKQLDAMQTNYEQLDRRVFRVVDVILPAQYSEGLVYAEMEQLLSGTQFVVDSVNVSATPNEPPTIYEPVTLSLNVTATSEEVTYEDFKALVRHLEQYPHLMTLDSLAYSPGTTSFTFVLKTYQRTPTL